MNALVDALKVGMLRWRGGKINMIRDKSDRRRGGCQIYTIFSVRLITGYIPNSFLQSLQPLPNPPVEASCVLPELTDSADNLAHNLIPFHRLMSLPDLGPIQHAVNFRFKCPIDDSR